MAREDDEDPAEVLLRAVRATQNRRKYARTSSAMTGRVTFSEQLWDVVRHAARARNLHLGAYIRRATLAFAAYDLGLDFDLMTRDQWAKPITPNSTQARNGRGGGPSTRPIPENEVEGIGQWKITGLH